MECSGDDSFKFIPFRIYQVLSAVLHEVKVCHSLIAIGVVRVSPTVSQAQLMKGGAHPSPFAALSFPNSIKVPIYCWVGRLFLSLHGKAQPRTHT